MKILTFDIEEWFHILDNNSTKTESNWNFYEERIYSNMDKIFSLIEKHNLKATFFIVGWIAKKYPDIVKKIDNRGHQIGSHTHMHQLLYEQNPKDFKKDLNKSINTIEDIISKKVKIFRAPGFSVTEQNKWVFEILIESGITHDCSIFPAGRSHGGFPSYKNQIPSIIEVNGMQIKEFPINTVSVFNYKYIFSGGGYFRVTPYYFIKKWTDSSPYVMTYFHPRDFDFNQPVITDLNIIRKFKSYVGLKKCYSKLDNWLNDFDFIDLRMADNMINWDEVPILKF